MKTAIELDVFQEMKLEENTGEIVMRSMAEMMKKMNQNGRHCCKF